MSNRPAPSRPLTLVSVAALVALALTGCSEQPAADPTGSVPPVTSPSATETPSESPTATPTPTASGEAAVYYVIDTRTGLRLAPEPHDVSGDAVQAAVERMIAGPDDPDYTSTWNPATEVLGVTMGDPITVDLSEDARTASVGSPGAAIMIQQLVHTVTAAAGEESAGVLLTIEGEPAGELWGAVEWSEPVTREAPLDVQHLVQIDTPREGATATSPVTVSGQAAVFEATLPWKVLDESGAEVASGSAMTAEGQTFAPYTFEVELEPGTYSIVITEADPSAGEAGESMSDSKTVTVG